MALGSEMDDAIHLVVLHQLQHQVEITDIDDYDDFDQYDDDFEKWREDNDISMTDIAERN